MDTPTEKQFIGLWTLRGVIDACAALEAVDKLDVQQASTHENKVLIVTIYNSLFDTICIDWCKVFGNKNEKHHWRKLIERPEHEAFQARFERRMRAVLTVTSPRLETFDHVSMDAFVELVRGYRDKYASHLDSSSQVKQQHYPSVPVLRETAWLLYSQLYEGLAGCNEIKSYPTPDQLSGVAYSEKVKRFHEAFLNGLEG